MILGYRTTVPSFPPQKYLIFLIIGNLIIHMYSQHFMLYQVFIYIYGMMTLLPQNYYYNLYLSQTIFINLLLLTAHFCRIHLTEKEQFLIFALICIIFIKIIWNSILQLLNSVRRGRSVTFSQIFIAIQYIALNKFIIYFTGFTFMRNIPIHIRIVQSLKISTPKSLLAIFRFFLIIVVVYIPSTHILWITCMCIFTFWKIYNDYKYTFKIQRVFTKQFCYFPKYIYLLAFLFDFICRIYWMFPFPHYVLVTILRKLLQNYFRFESQSAQKKDEEFVRAILDMTDIQNISV